MGDVNLDIENIRKLAELVEKHSLSELTLEEDGLCITIKGKNADEMTSSNNVACYIPSHPAGEASVHVDSSIEEEDEEEISPGIDNENVFKITSPMVGVFYRASTPESPPFVEIGDEVEVGQTIGLIEAMKVFSEIPSEFSGIVVDILADNGKLVQQGEILMYLKSKEQE